MNRYDRQIRVSEIGEHGQKKISEATILIVGCGALGSYCAEQLVRGGIKKLILVDFDHVDVSNLQRQALFVTEDAETKQKKVFAAQKQLRRINPQVTIEVYDLPFEQVIFEDLGTIDLIVDCTDNFHTRSLINLYAYQNNLPFVFGACNRTTGQVMAIHPRKNPCLNCLFPKLEELEKEDCNTVGVVTPLIPLVTSLQVTLVYKILLENATLSWDTLTNVDVWDFSINHYKVTKKTTCPTCSSNNSTVENVPVLKKICGTEVYQTNLSLVELSAFIDFCKEQNYPIQENPLASKMTVDTLEITLFKNGKVLIYGLKDKDKLPRFLKNLAKGA